MSKSNFCAATGWQLHLGYKAYREQVEVLFGLEPEKVRIDTPFLDARLEAERQEAWREAKGTVPQGPFCSLP
jgi:hypothetical protein